MTAENETSAVNGSEGKILGAFLLLSIPYPPLFSPLLYSARISPKNPLPILPSPSSIRPPPPFSPPPPSPSPLPSSQKRNRPATGAPDTKKRDRASAARDAGFFLIYSYFENGKKVGKRLGGGNIGT